MLRWFFLVLAVVGAIMPMRYFLAWFRDNGFDLNGMVAAWHANDASSGLVWDLTIAAVALTVWIVAEVWTRRAPRIALLSVAATFGIGVSCGLPLYLFFRSGPKR